LRGQANAFFCFEILADIIFLRYPGQTSLPDTCSVCAHTPLSPDLCKPNKALRTTLKAFLRTEEKKREKERQSAAPVTPVITTPAENDATPTEPVLEQKQSDEAPIEISETAAPAESKDVEARNEAPVVDAVADTDAPESTAPANEVWRFIHGITCSIF
jgi:hypothetical protein